MDVTSKACHLFPAWCLLETLHSMPAVKLPLYEFREDAQEVHNALSKTSPVSTVSYFISGSIVVLIFDSFLYYFSCLCTSHYLSLTGQLWMSALTSCSQPSSKHIYIYINHAVKGKGMTPCKNQNWIMALSHPWHWLLGWLADKTVDSQFKQLELLLADVLFFPPMGSCLLHAYFMYAEQDLQYWEKSSNFSY